MNSAEWFARAEAVMPGGVNSPVRAFGAVGGIPPFVTSASGAYLSTVAGERLIDFVSSWGAIVYGHADPDVVEAVAAAAAKGTSFGMPTPGEVEIAELITELVPSIDVLRFVNSGTEATMSAIRVARGATGREVVIKFAGCYHGHGDSFLVQAGSGAATFGEPNSLGVPAGTVATTRVVAYNDLAAVKEALAPGDVACVIVEPVAGNMGVVPPSPEFLDGLRTMCDGRETLLIFDEVMTGFRIARGGAQERYGVTADLTVLGKIVAGGTPAAVYGGREDLMRLVSPDGGVYQAGTLAGNPLAVAAGLTTLRRLQNDDALYEQLERSGQYMQDRLEAVLRDTKIVGCVQRVGSMMTVFFGVEVVTRWGDAEQLDTARFAKYFHAALDGGVMLPPSAYEAMFLTAAHSDEITEQAADVLVAAIRGLAE
ncbi:MAG: glutamate-1-semialdehyde 2,1-aminomutase [Acidobacteria bacterium]|nr:glutamate-1-semialdehyde 2,1-aminomutase [Acidobacteriota bacterium]